MHDLTALPLRHEDTIRQQASDKGLDPSLIAAVIYAESKFSDSTSAAGALGLMQLLPSTAHFIADRSGGTAFTTEDLSTPEINIAYGSWYLRYLLDRYDGDEVLALAAYNGGMGNVDRWVADARTRGERLDVADIPFPETRAYVERVLDARRDYRRTYAERARACRRYAARCGRAPAPGTVRRYCVAIGTGSAAPSCEPAGAS